MWIAPRAAGRREGEETSDRGVGPVRATGDIMPSFGRPYINSPTSFWPLLPSSFTVLRQLWPLRNIQATCKHLHQTRPIMAVGNLFTIFIGFVAVSALAVYFFGIPPEVKRKLERKALQTMGENKMSYIAKGTHLSAHPSVSRANTPQIKSPKSPPQTRKTSSSSRRGWATPWAGPSAILWARLAVKLLIRSLARSLAADCCLLYRSGLGRGAGIPCGRF